MPELKWCAKTDGGVLLRLHVQPKASRTEVAGIHGDRLKIRIAAPPVDGEANEELLRFLKKTLNLTLSALKIIRGSSSKQKDVECAGIGVTDAVKILSPEAEC